MLIFITVRILLYRSSSMSNFMSYICVGLLIYSPYIDSTHIQYCHKEKVILALALCSFLCYFYYFMFYHYLDDDLFYVPNWQFKLLFPFKCSQLAFISCLYLTDNINMSRVSVLFFSHEIFIVLNFYSWWQWMCVRIMWWILCKSFP